MHKKGCEKTGPFVGAAAAHKEGFMEENEMELFRIVRNSADPAKVASYAINLFLDYLQKHESYQEIPSADRPVSA